MQIFLKSTNFLIGYKILSSQYLLLVETIPQEGDTFQEFTTRENYPLPPYKKLGKSYL